MDKKIYFSYRSSGIYWLSCLQKLLRKGYNVIGIDNLNSYYSVKLKKDRLRDLYKIKKN